jgi:hypothetical protein
MWILPPTRGERALGAVLLVLLVTILGLIVWCAEASAAEKSFAPLPTKASAWVERAAVGFWEAIMDETPGGHWYDCGVATPFGERVPRAKALAETTLRTMHEHNLRVNPWGVMSVIFLESRGNPCSIGPNTRKNAEKLDLLPKDKDGNRKRWTQYTREDVLAVITNPTWVKRGYIADVGLVQDIFPKYARVLDSSGPLKCMGKLKAPCRIPTPEELVSVKGGAEIAVHGMLTRVEHFHTTSPWFFWSWVPRPRYSTNLAITIRRLGGSEKETFPWN